MIAHLRGILLQATADWVVIETGGVGYQVHVSAATRAGLGRIGDMVAVHIHTNVRADQIALFGFASAEELEMFRWLIEVDGVGPRVALGILGSASLEVLRQAILSEDVGLIRRAPGVGAKTAAKVLIELKPRLEAAGGLQVRAGSGNGQTPVLAAEVEDALRNLGFRPEQARAAVAGIDWSSEPDLQAALAEALRRVRPA